MSNPLDDPKADPFEIASLAAQVIAEKSGVAKHDIAMTLGSGWAKSADLIGETIATIDASDVPGFTKSEVVGHISTIRSILLPSVPHEN
jgi:purine-nucleoside phosphorylase